MSFDAYSGILTSNLFLQTPLVEIESNSEVHNSYQYLSEQLIKATTAPVKTKESYRSFIQIANVARDLIIEYDKVRDEEDLYTVFQLWNVRLTSLLYASELSLAQQEAKRLSSAFDKIVRADSAVNSKKPVVQNLSLFPNTVPLSLKILVIRLRSIGPNTVLSNEYYLILWDLRQQYVTEEDKRADVYKIIEILAYGVSANLIAKREYATFLTHADSIIKGLDASKELSDEEKLYKDKISFLATLVSLVKGDWELATVYFEGLGEHLKPIIESLQYILNNVNPVLDYKRPSVDASSQEEIHLSAIETLDDLFGLIKDQLITGRILCSLCALFELKLRDKSDHDIFDDGAKYKNASVSYDLFKLWHKNTSKLYGFE